MRPSRPQVLSDHALATLDALAESRLGRHFTIGGALGLLHYLDYRSTNDVDAWWEATATTQDRTAVLAVVERALEAFGKVTQRTWGDVTSIDLQEDGRTIFSFQIAARSARLEPPVPTGWSSLLLESFADLVASKMVALVERGAPRDFRDIREVCRSGLATPEVCWNWWLQRQLASGSQTLSGRARLAIASHLARIAQHRPLVDIADTEERDRAAATRHWFLGEFLDALVD